VKPGWLRQSLIAASILGYALLAHYSNAANAAVLGVTLATAPPLLALLLLARRARWPWLVLPATVLLAGALLRIAWPLLEHNFPLMYLLQQCAAYLMMAAGFARSLMPRQVPLCTQWAGMLHGPLPAPVQRYTRAVTAAWSVFFVAIGLSSALLYLLAPLRVWSLFSNFLTLPLAILMFAGEYALRRRLVPSMRRSSLADSARAYFAARRHGAAPR
jgi:uncharacterized membrane protein